VVLYLFVYFLHGKLARILIKKCYQLWTQNFTKLCVDEIDENLSYKWSKKAEK